MSTSIPQPQPHTGVSLTTPAAETPAAEDVPLWRPKGWRSSSDVSTAALLMPVEPVVTVHPVTASVAEAQATDAVGQDAEAAPADEETEIEAHMRQGIGWTPSFFSLAQISSGGAKWSLAAVQDAIQPQADDVSTSASGCASSPDTLEPHWVSNDEGRPTAEGGQCAEEVRHCDAAPACAGAPGAVEVPAVSSEAVAPPTTQERETLRETDRSAPSGGPCNKAARQNRLQQYRAEVSELRRLASEEAMERQRLETVATSATQQQEESEARVAELTQELSEAQRQCTLLEQKLAEQQESHAALKEDLEHVGRENATLEARLEEEHQLRLSAEQRVNELTLKVSSLGDSPDTSKVMSVGEAELPATDLQLIGDWSAALGTSCTNSPPVGSARSTSFAEPSASQGHLSATASTRGSWLSGSSPSRGSRSGVGSAVTPSTDGALMGPATASVDLTAPLHSSDGLPCMGVLSMRDLSEIKALKKPPPPIRMLMEVCCLLFNIDPMKLPDERAPRGWRLDYWEPARRSLLSDPFFLSKLRGFDDEVQPAQRTKIRRYFQDPEFTADRVRNCSKAAYELYAWVSSLLAQQSADGCSPRQ